jgi:hypothetical protein
LTNLSTCRYAKNPSERKGPVDVEVIEDQVRYSYSCARGLILAVRGSVCLTGFTFCRSALLSLRIPSTLALPLYAQADLSNCAVLQSTPGRGCRKVLLPLVGKGDLFRDCPSLPTPRKLALPSHPTPVYQVDASVPSRNQHGRSIYAHGHARPGLQALQPSLINSLGFMISQ